MFAFYRENARWLLGGFVLTLFSAFGQTFFISIWGEQIRETFDLTHGGFGSVYMLATLASAAVFPFVGRLVDQTSVALCSTIVIVMLSAAALSMAFINHIALLIITIFLLRLFGQGMMGHTAITAMGRWYSANRGKAVASVTIGHQASEAIAPTLFVAFAVYYGWRGAWVLAAISLLVVALPTVVLLMRKERVPRSPSGDLPSPIEEGRQWTRVEVVRDPLFWLMCMGIMSPAFIGTSIWFHQDYLIDFNGWTKLTWASAFALMAATTIAGSLLTGYAIDRWSAVQILPLFLVPLGLACLVLGSFSAVWAIYATMLLIGTSYGISSSLFGALWPETYGVRHLGSVRALIMAFMVFSSAAGPGITGVLIDAGVSFPDQLLVIALYCFVTAGLMLVASRKVRRRRSLELKTLNG